LNLRDTTHSISTIFIMPPRNKKAKKSPVEKTKVQGVQGKRTPARGKKSQKTQKAKAPAASRLLSTPKTPSPLQDANVRFLKSRSLVREFDATAAAAAKDVASTSTSGLRAAAAALGAPPAPPVAPLAREEVEAEDQAGGEDSNSAMLISYYKFHL
jgi:hypothetical protein